MLVLSRKRGEQLLVPELNLVVTILELHGGQVRLGISAPPDVKVFRREVWECLQDSSTTEECTALAGK